MENDSGSVASTEEESSEIRLVHVGSSTGSLQRKEFFQSSEVSIETRIHNDPTFDSSDVEDGSPTGTSPRSRDSVRESHIAKKRVTMDTTFQEVFGGGDLRRVDSTDTGDTGNTFYSQWEYQQNHTIYISLFATFGAVIRIFMGRLFGLDCERFIEIDDFLTPFSSEICVTASGKTDQTGGAFFSDLPSNILGSFFIGVLSPAIASGHPIPWFRKDHRLQHHEAFHTALKVGLCGCLTTCKLSPVSVAYGTFQHACSVFTCWGLALCS
jgi:fluoride ion exporter CrcB/FEX